MVGVAFICCTFVAKIQCHLVKTLYNNFECAVIEEGETTL